MTKSRLVIFDICGTLFFSNTSFDFLDLIVQAKSYSLFRKVSKTIFARIINKVSVLLLKKDLIRSIAVLYIKECVFKIKDTPRFNTTIAYPMRSTKDGISHCLRDKQNNWYLLNILSLSSTRVENSW